MASFEAVLFDFGHTLFHPSPIVLVDLEPSLSREQDQLAFDDVFERAWERSRTPEEIAKGRDLSAAAHYKCWLELLAPLNRLAAGLADSTYDFMCSPAGWEPYPDTVEVLTEMNRRRLAVGIVSDCGWDIRSVFIEQGLAEFVQSYDLSYERGICKPDKEIFASACHQLSVEPARSVMVGDTWLTDGGAAALGIVTLILPARDRIAEPALRPVLDLVR